MHRLFYRTNFSMTSRFFYAELNPDDDGHGDDENGGALATRRRLIGLLLAEGEGT